MFWNPYTMDVLARGEGHVSNVRHCLVDDENDRVITISAEKTVRCWDSNTLSCIQVKSRTEKRVHPTRIKSEQKRREGGSRGWVI